MLGSAGPVEEEEEEEAAALDLKKTVRGEGTCGATSVVDSTRREIGIVDNLSRQKRPPYSNDRIFRQLYDVHGLGKQTI